MRVFALGPAAAIVVLLFTTSDTSEMTLSYDVCFSPKGPSCETLLNRTIDQAKREVLGEFYTWTLTSLADHMVLAKNNRRIVEVIIDKTTIDYGSRVIQKLEAAKIPIYTDCTVETHHDKVLITDSDTTCTGSFNPTYTGEHLNAENVLCLRSYVINKKYKEDFLAQKARSTRGTSCPKE